MSTFLAFLLAMVCSNSAASAEQQGGSAPSPPPTEQVILHKDGGPGHGPEQPYSVREQGATDLEGFVGGKQVVLVAPYDVFILALVVALVIVLVILI